MDHVLIVEDEAIIRAALRRLLEYNQYQISEAASVRDAQEKYDLNQFSLIISDLRLPGAPGTDLIRLAENVPVLIMTSYASLRSAVDSMKMGAVDYIAKPFDNDEILAAVKRVIKAHPRKQSESNEKPPQAVAGMIGTCGQMLAVYERIHKVAPTHTTVLVRGETGNGKELVARAIHQESSRADKPLICVNCAAIPETLIESELFGYEKGAFTGAATNRMGLIEAADGGTLFLDEIGELPVEAQARLLRFIQESEIRRIGSTLSRKVDVRLITATHRDLKQLSTEGKFRQDLYYRINVVKINLPALRERGKDILEIAETLLDRAAVRFEKQELKFSPKAIQAITTYAWPGNVRELENAIERATILSSDDTIDSDLLDIDMDLVDISEIQEDTREEVVERTGLESKRMAKRNREPAEDLSLEEYFQRFVLENQDQMSETQLAKKLGISRKCLWERRQRFGIRRSKGTATAAKPRKTA